MTKVVKSQVTFTRAISYTQAPVRRSLTQHSAMPREPQRWERPSAEDPADRVFVQLKLGDLDLILRNISSSHPCFISF